MSTTTTIVLGIIILAVIVIALVMATRSGRMRRPALKTLPPESRERYVREADALMLAMLGEREHPLAEEKLPANMRRARREATGKEGKGGTEGMRLALLHYRAVIEEYARPEDREETQRRREVAS